MSTQMPPTMPTDIHLSGRGRSFARRCHVFDNKKPPQPSSTTRTKKESSSRRSQVAPENDEDRYKYTLRQRYEASKSNSRTVIQRMSCKSIKESKSPKRQVSASPALTDPTRRQDQEPSSTTVAQQSDPPEGSFSRPSRKVVTTTLRRHTMASKVIPTTNLPVRERTVVNRYPTTIDLEGKSLPVITFKSTTTPRRHTLGNEDCFIHDTWYYSSNHVLVNRERVERGIPALRRRIHLDELARDHAQKLADEGGVTATMKSLLIPGTATMKSLLIPGNIFRGHSIRQIHQETMCRDGQCNERENILNPAFTEFGMATKKGTDGLLYLVQFFDSVPIDTRVEI